MRLIFAISFFLFSFSVKAQDQRVTGGERSRTIDSLNRAYKIAEHDTDKINCLFALGEVLIGPDPDTCLILNKKARETAEKGLESGPPPTLEKKYLASLADALNNIGYLHEKKGDLTKAMKYYHKSLKIRESIGDGNGIATSFNNIGYLYMSYGDITTGLEYYHKSLNIQEEIGDKKGIALSLNNIGYVYKYQGDISTALGYYQKSLKIREEIGNKKGIATSLNNIGMINSIQGDKTLALEYYEKSLKIYEDIGDKSGVAYSLNNIGYLYLKLGNTPDALEYYLKSLKIQEALSNKSGISRCLGNIAQLLLQQNDKSLHEAKEYASQSLALALEIGSPDHIHHAASYLSIIAKKQGNYKKALEMYELHIQMRDSIKNEETQKATIRQQTKYEFEKAQLVKEQAEKEAARIVAEETSRRDNLQYSVILIALLVLFGGVLSLGFVKVSPRMAEGIIFFSFLILFEFLLVLADPYIDNWSSGAPGIKLLFNAGIAALIFPMHSLFESKLKKRLVKSLPAGRQG